MADHLTPLDAAFLELEDGDESSHMHVGWTLVFDPLPGGGTPGVEQLVRLLDGAPRAASPLPTAALVAARGPRLLARVGRGSRLRRGEPGATARACRRRAATPSCSTGSATSTRTGSTAPTRCGRSRCSTGSSEGRWALACKVHHCLVDGVSGALVTSVLLDAEPRAAGRLPGAARDASARAGGRSGAVAAGAAGARRAGGHGRGAPPAPARAGCSSARARSPTSSSTTSSWPRRPRASTSTSGRRGGWPRSPSRWPISRRSSTRSAAPSTTSCWPRAPAGCAHSWRSRGEPLPAAGIRAQVPVSVRDASELLALGNRVSSLFVDLPVDARTPLSRYRRTVSATKRLKAGRRRAGAEAMVDLAGLSPPVLHALAGPALVRAPALQRHDHQRARRADDAVRLRRAACRGRSRSSRSSLAIPWGSPR